jgi:hypothetical protein
VIWAGLPQKTARLARVAVFGLMLHAQAAEAGDGHYFVDLGVGGGFATNPFLQSPSKSGAYADFRVDPQASFSNERSTTVMAGQFDLRRYLNGLGSSSSYGVTVHRTTKSSERLTIDAGLAFNSSKNDDRRFIGLLGEVVPGQTGSGTIDPLGALLTPRQRRTVASAQFGGNLRLNERDTASLGVFGNREIISNSPIAANFWTVGTNADFRRSLSPLTSVGAGLSVQRLTYDSGGGGYTIVKPQFLFKRQFSTFWQLNGSIGALVVNGTLFGRSRKLFSVSGAATACRTAELSSMCASVSQDAGGSGVGGLRVAQRASVTYSRQAGPNNRLSLNSSYSRYGSGDLPDTRPSTQWQVGGSWNRKLRDRLTAVAELGYRHGSLPGYAAASDLSVRLGVSFRVGEVK